MERDTDFSLAVLQGIEPSQVGLHPSSMLGRWSQLHTLDEAALWHIRAYAPQIPTFGPDVYINSADDPT